jgi:hypothetical protein
MFRKLSNKLLLIIFVILAIVAVIVLVHDSKKGERTFKSELFSVDSAAVSSITIYPKGNGKDILKLKKSGKEWDVVFKDKHYPADSSLIKNILHELAHITPERVSGTDKTSWKQFEISDSASSRVVVEQGNAITADFRVGKVSFTQGQGPQRYRTNQNVDVKSHLRVAGDDRVYEVEGFLSMMFSNNPAQYRNRMLLRFDKNQVMKLTFIYPGDSSFVLARKGNKWYIDDQPADSSGTEKYLNSTYYINGNEFADESAVFPNYRYTLKIEGNNMSPIEVNGAIDEGVKKYYIKSNANPSAIFGSASPNLFNQIFKGKSSFFPGKAEGKEKKVTKQQSHRVKR